MENCDYIGAIRITPMVDREQTERFSKFFGIRHMRRDVDALNKLYPDMESREAVTLMGDGNFGPEGIFYMPIKTCEVSYRTLSSQVEGLNIPQDCSKTPEGCPSLYSSVVIVPSQDGVCSYLGWDQNPDSTNVAGWIKLVADLLVPLGHHLEGEIFGSLGGGCEFLTIAVKDADVVVEDLVPPSTYDTEFYDARVAAGME